MPACASGASKCGDPEVAEQFMPMIHLVFSNLKTWGSTASTTASARSIYKPTSMSSRSASTGVSTRSTRSARCSASRAVLRRRPMPTFIPACGRTLHLAGVCVNQIGTVLHLVENILAVAPVAVELTERLCFFVERSDQNRVFVDFRRFADLDERKLRRATIVAQRKPESALQAPAQHDHAPLPAPARQPNLALLRLEALAGANPFA